MRSRPTIVHQSTAQPQETSGVTYSLNAGIVGTIVTVIVYPCSLATAKFLAPQASRVEYQFYFGIGSLLITLIILKVAGEEMWIDGLSLLSGLLFAVTVRVTVTMISAVGLSLFSQIQPPFASCIGFAFGHFVCHAASRSIPLACVGLAIAVVGLISASRVISNQLQVASSNNGVDKDSKNTIWGVLGCLLAGFLGGLMFAPSHFEDTQHQKVTFCLGVCISFQCFFTLYYAAVSIADRFKPLSLDALGTNQSDAGFDVTIPAGLAGGVLMGIANIATFYGFFSNVGFGVTVAVRNSAGCVQWLLLGAFVFKEFGDVDFWFASKLLSLTALVAAGIVLLMVFGIK